MCCLVVWTMPFAIHSQLTHTNHKWTEIDAVAIVAEGKRSPIADCSIVNFYPVVAQRDYL